MKTTPVCILLVGILGTHSAFAEDPPRKQRPTDESPRRNFMEAWKKADSNNDSALSFEEFSTLPRLQAIPEEKRAKLFERLDKDDNNLLTLEEMQRMRQSKHNGPNHRKRLWELDTDKSGGITWEEFSAGEMFRKLPPEKQRKLFDRLDTNKDGIISPDDRPERPRRKRPNDQESPRRPILFPNHDTNNDGFLDFKEFAQIPGISRLGEDDQENAFDKIDTNKDLKLSPGEMADFRPLDRAKDKAARPNKPRKNPSSPEE